MTIDFNNSPYYDDFEAGALDKNYMRILFRPGYAVQARELTQIQSIVQNQIKQFGNHIFKDGSPVIGGHLSLDTSAVYIKLDKQFGGSDIDLDNFIGSTVFNNTSPRTRARVLQTYSTSTDRTLMVKYLRGPIFQAGQTISTPVPGSFQANIASPNYTGTGSIVTINEGVFYVRGFFVKVPQQTIVLDPYNSKPTYRVGLEIDENVVTESEDTSLLDPALESFNFQAPGADRYQFNLNLAKRSLNSIDDSQFFELLRVENGVITRQVNYPIYSELEKTLARRTYDESGNYVVKPFRANLSANTPAGLPEDTSTFLINIEPGKAYVNGFEFETIGTQTVSAPRARTYITNKDSDLSVYYGNFIQLTDVVGSAEGVGFSEDIKDIDIHCVTEDQVSLTGNTHTYYATKIGSAKIKNFDYSSQNTYQTNLIDISFTPMIGEASDNSLYLDQIYLPEYFSSAQDAYVDGVVTMLSGAAAGQSSIITNYNGTSKLAALSVRFTNQVAAGDKFSLSVPFSAAESLVRANTSSFTSANVVANVSIESKDAIGSAFLDDTNFNKNVFKLSAGNSDAYVRYDSDTNVSLYRRLVKRVTFTSNGAFTLGLAGVDEGEFDFGGTSGQVSNDDVRRNIIVVPVSGVNAGQILDMTTSGRSVTKQTNQQITLYTNNGSGGTFNADIYVTVKLEGAESGRRTKTLIEANTALTSGDTLSSATSVVGYTAVKINAANGIAWFTTSDVIVKVPGQPQSLFISDVVRIKKIYDSGNISNLPTPSNMIDITDRYAFDSGQKDHYYDHGSIILKPGFNPPAGQMVVLFDYYQHSGSGYLSAKSYPESLYNAEEIPIYKSISGDLFNLRDSIDLRPIRDSGIVSAPLKLTQLSPTINVALNSTTVVANTAKSANVLSPPITTGTTISIGGKIVKVDSVINTQAFTISTTLPSAATDSAVFVVEENKEFAATYIQKPSRALTLDYDYYLPRIDKLVITRNKEFKLINGVPSLDPIEPASNEDSLQIYRFIIPPYTASINSIDAQYIDNRRYTMKDISQIDKRLAELAEFVRLKNSEADIINNPPKSPLTPTVNKPIYGTLVDEFNDLSVADTTGDFAASIENGKLTCYKLHSEFELIPRAATNLSSDGFQDKFLTLPYTEVEAVSQKFATANAAATVQTAIIGKFEGFVSLTPESDYFYSTVHQPAITDTIGRFYEVDQNTRERNDAITDAIAENLGSDKYRSANYSGVVIAGQYRDAVTDRKIYIPNVFSGLTDAENSLVRVDVNFLGVAPETFLNKTWTGYTSPLVVDGKDANPFSAGWKENSSIQAGSGLNINDAGLYNLE